MSEPRTYWAGQQFVVEWTLLDASGVPVTGATVAGTVSLPDGTTASMTVVADGNTYTASYTAATPGRHSFELVASGVAVDAVQGQFTVHRDLVGAAPITVDPSTDVGMVRLLITDTDEISPLFEDAQITAFLTAEGGKVKLAAATALETIARSETLVAKKISTQDLSTDGPAVAAELRASAKALRDQVAKDEQDDDDTAASQLLPLWAFPTPVSWGDSYL